MKHQFSFIVTLTLITIVNINCEEIVYRSGVGKEYIEEIPISLEEEIDENDPLYKRRAESETEAPSRGRTRIYPLAYPSPPILLSPL